MSYFGTWEGARCFVPFFMMGWWSFWEVTNRWMTGWLMISWCFYIHMYIHTYLLYLCMIYICMYIYVCMFHLIAIFFILCNGSKVSFQRQNSRNHMVLFVSSTHPLFDSVGECRRLILKHVHLAMVYNQVPKNCDGSGLKNAFLLLRPLVCFLAILIWLVVSNIC